jgi:orotate phosphoribosyltransferase
MNSEEVIEIYKKHFALMKGHFLLSSGLHSDTYLQSELVMQYTFIARLL